MASLKLWALAALPLAGLVELGAHLWQTRSVVPESDWEGARELVRAELKTEDLIAFAPRWTSPIGRQVFGGELATQPRMARADVSRFPRAFEVSIRGGRDPELVGWSVASEKKAGRVTVRTLTNPSYAPTLDDLLAHVSPAGLAVARRDANGDAPCAWAPGPAGAGGLGAGPATPRERFLCSSGIVGISVTTDLDYHPHRCLLVTPPGGAASIALTFRGVKVGEVLHGHHGLYVEAERTPQGPPVTLTFKVGDRSLGRVIHRDGDGWKAFDLPTSELKGQTVDLVAEVSAASGNRRIYCFEGITR